jgi:hypothetical protein
MVNNLAELILMIGMILIEVLLVKYIIVIMMMAVHVIKNLNVIFIKVIWKGLVMKDLWLKIKYFLDNNLILLMMHLILVLDVFLKKQSFFMIKKQTEYLEWACQEVKVHEIKSQYMSL